MRRALLALVAVVLTIGGLFSVQPRATAAPMPTPVPVLSSPTSAQ